MKAAHFTETPAEAYDESGNITIRWVINRSDGAPHFAMRVIEVKPGFNTPYHTHDFEHEVYVLEGKGVVKSAGAETPIQEGSVVFVAPGEEHGFYNRGNDILRFICVIPHQG